jgi:ankyrin repeat protein
MAQYTQGGAAPRSDAADPSAPSLFTKASFASLSPVERGDRLIVAIRATSPAFDPYMAVRFSLAHGASPNAVSEDGNTALHWACWSDYPHIVRALIAAGADIARRNHSGETPAMWASIAGSLTCLLLLAEADAARRRAVAADALAGARALHADAAAAGATAAEAAVAAAAPAPAIGPHRAQAGALRHSAPEPSSSSSAVVAAAAAVAVAAAAAADAAPEPSALAALVSPPAMVAAAVAAYKATGVGSVVAARVTARAGAGVDAGAGAGADPGSGLSLAAHAADLLAAYAPTYGDGANADAHADAAYAHATVHNSDNSGSSSGGGGVGGSGRHLRGYARGRGSPAWNPSESFVFDRCDAGFTCLHIAVRYAKRAAVDLLLSLGSDVGACDASGQTPLHHACALNHIPVVELLLTRGADLAAADAAGNTPLHALAAADDFRELATTLLRFYNGARALSARNAAGETPARVARRCGRGRLAAALEARDPARRSALTRLADRMLYDTETGKDRSMMFIGLWLLVWMAIWLFHHMFVLHPVFQEQRAAAAAKEAATAAATVAASVASGPAAPGGVPGASKEQVLALATAAASAAAAAVREVLPASLPPVSAVLFWLGGAATIAAWLVCHYADPGYALPAPHLVRGVCVHQPGTGEAIGEGGTGAAHGRSRYVLVADPVYLSMVAPPCPPASSDPGSGAGYGDDDDAEAPLFPLPLRSLARALLRLPLVPPAALGRLLSLYRTGWVNTADFTPVIGAGVSASSGAVPPTPLLPLQRVSAPSLHSLSSAPVHVGLAAVEGDRGQRGYPSYSPQSTPHPLTLMLTALRPSAPPSASAAAAAAAATATAAVTTVDATLVPTARAATAVCRPLELRSSSPLALAAALAVTLLANPSLLRGLHDADPAAARAALGAVVAVAAALRAETRRPAQRGGRLCARGGDAADDADGDHDVEAATARPRAVASPVAGAGASAYALSAATATLEAALAAFGGEALVLSVWRAARDPSLAPYAAAVAVRGGGPYTAKGEERLVDPSGVAAVAQPRSLLQRLTDCVAGAGTGAGAGASAGCGVRRWLPARCGGSPAPAHDADVTALRALALAGITAAGSGSSGSKGSGAFVPRFAALAFTAAGPRGPLLPRTLPAPHPLFPSLLPRPWATALLPHPVPPHWLLPGALAPACLTMRHPMRWFLTGAPASADATGAVAGPAVGAGTGAAGATRGRALAVAARERARLVSAWCERLCVRTAARLLQPAAKRFGLRLRLKKYEDDADVDADGAGGGAVPLAAAAGTDGDGDPDPDADADAVLEAGLLRSPSTNNNSSAVPSTAPAPARAGSPSNPGAGAGAGAGVGAGAAGLSSLSAAFSTGDATTDAGVQALLMAVLAPAQARAQGRAQARVHARTVAAAANGVKRAASAGISSDDDGDDDDDGNGDGGSDGRRSLLLRTAWLTQPAGDRTRLPGFLPPLAPYALAGAAPGSWLGAGGISSDNSDNDDDDGEATYDDDDDNAGDGNDDGSGGDSVDSDVAVRRAARRHRRRAAAAAAAASAAHGGLRRAPRPRAHCPAHAVSDALVSLSVAPAAAALLTFTHELERALSALLAPPAPAQTPAHTAAAAAPPLLSAAGALRSLLSPATAAAAPWLPSHPYLAPPATMHAPPRNANVRVLGGNPMAQPLPLMPYTRRTRVATVVAEVNTGADAPLPAPAVLVSPSAAVAAAAGVAPSAVAAASAAASALGTTAAFAGLSTLHASLQLVRVPAGPVAAPLPGDPPMVSASAGAFQPAAGSVFALLTAAVADSAHRAVTRTRRALRPRLPAAPAPTATVAPAPGTALWAGSASPARLALTNVGLQRLTAAVTVAVVTRAAVRCGGVLAAPLPFPLAAAAGAILGSPVPNMGAAALPGAAGTAGVAAGASAGAGVGSHAPASAAAALLVSGSAAASAPAPAGLSLGWGDRGHTAHAVRAALRGVLRALRAHRHRAGAAAGVEWRRVRRTRVTAQGSVEEDGGRWEVPTRRTAGRRPRNRGRGDGDGDGSDSGSGSGSGVGGSDTDADTFAASTDPAPSGSSSSSSSSGNSSGDGGEAWLRLVQDSLRETALGTSAHARAAAAAAAGPDGLLGLPAGLVFTPDTDGGAGSGRGASVSAAEVLALHAAAPKDQPSKGQASKGDYTALVAGRSGHSAAAGDGDGWDGADASSACADEEAAHGYVCDNSFAHAHAHAYGHRTALGALGRESVPAHAGGSAGPGPFTLAPATLAPELSPLSSPWEPAARYLALQQLGIQHPALVCLTCRVAKPMRMKHCRRCNRCVYRHDHHCPWVDTCVGAHNYRAFMLFITLGTLLSWAYVACAVSYVFAVGLIGTGGPGAAKGRALRAGRSVVPLASPADAALAAAVSAAVAAAPGTAVSLSGWVTLGGWGGVLALLSCGHAVFMALFVTVLWISHLYLVSANNTTQEQIAPQHYIHHFDRGFLHNWLAFLRGPFTEPLLFPVPVLSKPVQVLIAGAAPPVARPAFPSANSLPSSPTAAAAAASAALSAAASAAVAADGAFSDDDADDAVGSNDTVLQLQPLPPVHGLARGPNPPPQPYVATQGAAAAGAAAAAAAAAPGGRALSGAISYSSRYLAMGGSLESMPPEPAPQSISQSQVQQQAAQAAQAGAPNPALEPPAGVAPYVGAYSGGSGSGGFSSFGPLMGATLPGDGATFPQFKPLMQMQPAARLPMAEQQEQEPTQEGQSRD